MEQELANPATNVSAAGSLEDVMRIARQPNVNDLDRVQLLPAHWYSQGSLA